MHTGSCLCGAVHFEVDGVLHPPDACHCTICRKVSGHVFASTDVPRSLVTIHGEDSICGSSLLFDPIHKDWIGIAMGAFDRPTDTKLAIHIFVADKGDYYDIADGLPQNPQ